MASTPRDTKKPAPKKKVVKKTVAPKKMGRPRKMTIEVFEKVTAILECSNLALNNICKQFNSSASAYYDIIDGDETGKLSEAFVRARVRQSHFFNDQIIEVAFDDKDDEKPFVGANHIQRDKLKMEALRIASERANPNKYGSKLDLTTKGEKIEMPLFPDVSKNDSDQ